jgi:hypothetical protein
MLLIALILFKRMLSTEQLWAASQDEHRFMESASVC